MRQALGIVALVCSISCLPPDDGGQGANGQNGQNGDKGPQGPEGPAGPPAATSGSRLKVRHYAGEDGMRSIVPGEFWDSKRDEACRMLMDESGVSMRCMPASAALVPPLWSYYADSLCQFPVLFTDAFKYGVEELPPRVQIGAEPRRFRAHLINPTKVTVPYYSVGYTGECRGGTYTVTGYKGTPIAPTEFAGAKVEQGQ